MITGSSATHVRRSARNAQCSATIACQRPRNRRRSAVKSWLGDGCPSLDDRLRSLGDERPWFGGGRRLEANESQPLEQSKAVEGDERSELAAISGSWCESKSETQMI
jgi:hypothetical protein